MIGVIFQLSFKKINIICYNLKVLKIYAYNFNQNQIKKLYL